VAITYPLDGSFVNQYLNRLSDLVWAMARWAEGPHHRTARTLEQ
jgi:cob(I)alamin adenosyltransferase